MLYLVPFILSGRFEEALLFVAGAVLFLVLFLLFIETINEMTKPSLSMDIQPMNITPEGEALLLDDGVIEPYISSYAFASQYIPGRPIPRIYPNVESVKKTVRKKLSKKRTKAKKSRAKN